MVSKDERRLCATGCGCESTFYEGETIRNPVSGKEERGRDGSMRALVRSIKGLSSICRRVSKKRR